MPVNTRIAGIDFWRGLVLVAILVDHIPGNGLEHLTPRNFALSDSAEAFVFLSGLSVGAIYVRRAERDGLSRVGKACGLRSLKLYGVHIGLTAMALALFALVSTLAGVPELLAPHGRAIVFQEPWKALGGILLMGHQLGYFNILPLYVVMMALAPIVIALTLASPYVALVASAVVYTAARAFDLNLPTAPDPGGWFFNPFAWQLMFTLGVALVKIGGERGVSVRPALVAASLAVALAGAAVVTDGFGLAPGLRVAAEVYGDFGKQNLGMARLLNFAALAYLALALSRALTFVDTRPGQALQRLGRHSLAMFAAGSILSAGGQALLAVAAKSALLDVATLLGLVYTLISIAALFILAYGLECRRQIPPGSGQKLARSPAPRLSPWRPSVAR
jgi:hypothetical protein